MREVVRHQLPVIVEQLNEFKDLEHAPMKWQENVVAVTGTIGSGKSAVVSFLKANGAFVVSADELAREVVKKGSPGFARVVEAFGQGILAPDGSIDRHKLGAVVFGSSESRKQLESITHPLIAELAAHKFKDALLKGEKFLVYEAPLLIEAGLHKDGFKKILVVTVSDDICVERMKARDSLTESQARQRLAAQLPAAEKARFADYVIDNSSDMQTLHRQLKTLLPELA